MEMSRCSFECIGSFWHNAYLLFRCSFYFIYQAAICLPKIEFLYLESAVRRIIPKTPQDIISPTPTVSIISGMGRFTPYP